MPPVTKAVSTLFGGWVIEQWKTLVWSSQDLWWYTAEYILGFNCKKTYKYECIHLHHWPLPLRWWISLVLLLPFTYFACKCFFPYLLAKLLHNISFDHLFHTPHYWVAPNVHNTTSAQTHQDEVRFLFFFPLLPLLPCCLRLREPASSQAVWAGMEAILQKCLGGSPSV